MAVKSICGVIFVTERVEALAEFYRKGLGIEFEREDHGGLDVHYGTDIGTVHFAIHPPSNFGSRGAGSGTPVAFAVDHLAGHLEALKALGAEVVEAPHDEGFGLVVTLADPEGNLFELVELSYDFASSKATEPGHG